MPGGGYRYHREAAFGPDYERAMDSVFGSTPTRFPPDQWVQGTWPRETGVAEAAHLRAVKAKSLDLLRGLLPGRLVVAHGHLRERPGL
jgi:hypothetical protein